MAAQPATIVDLNAIPRKIKREPIGKSPNESIYYFSKLLTGTDRIYYAYITLHCKLKYVSTATKGLQASGE